MTGFTGAVASKLAERWIALILTPAFVFWAGGLVAWTWDDSPTRTWREVGDWVGGLTAAEQIALTIAALLLVTVSGVIVQQLVLPVLRLLEGYWPRPLDGVRARIVASRSKRIARDETRLVELTPRVDGGKASADEHREYLLLDRRLRRVPTERDPARPVRRMPTRLGDVLRAGEAWPTDKYGLDGVQCWPRLWLVLPDHVRTEVTAARSRLDFAVGVLIWGVLFAGWAVWAWWALPVGVVGAIAGYAAALGCAATFADIVESAYDTHRRALYEALRWPLPTSPADEQEQGAAITEYLWRGSDSESPRLTP